jgi:hypothetical protein
VSRRKTSTAANQLGLFTRPPIPAPAPIAVPSIPSLEERIKVRALKPRRKRGSPGPQDVETAARDEALDALEAARDALIIEARKVAHQLVRQRGRITSIEVFQALRAYGYDTQIDKYDPRWMGCVFRTDEWERIGFEPTGSHKRPVAIWKLAE